MSVTDLDAKLESIIERDSFHMSTYHCVEAIKQAFTDAGYRQVTKDTADFYTLATVVTHTADFSKGELSKMMTGQEALKRLEEAGLLGHDLEIAREALLE
jgi:hypothetical protein